MTVLSVIIKLMLRVTLGVARSKVKAKCKHKVDVNINVKCKCKASVKGCFRGRFEIGIILYTASLPARRFADSGPRPAKIILFVWISSDIYDSEQYQRDTVAFAGSA